MQGHFPSHPEPGIRLGDGREARGAPLDARVKRAGSNPGVVDDGIRVRTEGAPSRVGGTYFLRAYANLGGKAVRHETSGVVCQLVRGLVKGLPLKGVRRVPFACQGTFLKPRGGFFPEEESPHGDI